jgi:hypothetical protein
MEIILSLSRSKDCRLRVLKNRVLRAALCVYVRKPEKLEMNIIKSLRSLYES